MSYFIGGFATTQDQFNTLETVFASLPHNPYCYDRKSFHKDPLFLTVFANQKAIPNVFIEQENQFLAAIGTTLCLDQNKKDLNTLVPELMDSPSSFFKRFDGNLSVITLDSANKSLVFATDINNTTPIFYSQTKSGLFFSSHELALAKFLNADIDEFGFAQVLQTGFTWESTCRFANIKKTLPCQIITFSPDNLSGKAGHYWQPKDEIISSQPFDNQVNNWLDLVKDAVQRYFDNSTKINSIKTTPIADFTAGEDSRLIIAACHALGIPVQCHVTGLDTDVDVVIAKEAANKVGLDLINRTKSWISKDTLLARAIDICLEGDGYQDFFAACVEYATERAVPIDDCHTLKYCGAPGGEAFRGSYYLRGKAPFPSSHSALDFKFFTKLKYLLDYYPGLLKFDDNEFTQRINGLVENNLQTVKHLPIGTQIDHLLRVFQTCFIGLKYKNPLYLPLATYEMTRSIYTIPPHFKQAGKLTKACTELMFPELAHIKTQNGVPTIRRTFWRFPLFIPEYTALIRKVWSGVSSRLFKWRKDNKWYYNQDKNAYMLSTLLNSSPYQEWFQSADTLLTGHLYQAETLNSLLNQARAGECKWMATISRVITQELVLRWVRGKTGSRP